MKKKEVKRILLFLFVGIFLLTLTSAFIFSVDDTFKEKVLTLSSSLFYDKLVSLNILSSKEVPKNTELDLSNSGLEITKNKEGILKVRAK